MKSILRFTSQSFVVGLVLLGIVYIVVHYATRLVKDYILEAELPKIALVLIAALLIGIVFRILYLNPINFIARLFLKSVAIYYQEFFKQGAKIFTSGNLSRPFQTIVEVAIDDNIKVLGFLTNRLSNNCSVIFIPTSRRLTSGFNIIVKNEKVSETKISPEEFLKYIVTSGAHQIISN